MNEQLKDLCIKKYEEKMNLEDCLNGYTKARLTEIGEAYDYDLPQSSRKAEMVDFMAPVIKSDLIRFFDEEGHEFSDQVHEIVVSEGRVAQPEDVEKFDRLLRKGILFIGKKDDEAWIFMPSDTSAIFETGRLGSEKKDREQLIFKGEPVHAQADEDRTPEESEMIMYAAALANMYGIYRRGMIREVWDLNHGHHIAPSTIDGLIKKAGDADGFYTRDDYIITNELSDPAVYCDLLDRIMEYDNYYYPTVKELKEYKDGPVVDEEIHKYYLRNFLARMLGMDVPALDADEKLDGIMDRLAFTARCDAPLSDVLKVLDEGGVRIPEADDQALFAQLYTDWLYNLRSWACKGYKPKDLPPAKMAFRNFRLPSNVDPNSEIRQGRNDPCRCGSGKKFKKCCAKCLL